MRVMHWHFALAHVAAAGCGQKPEATQTPAADTAGTMGGMAMLGMQMMPMMGAHLDSVAAMRPEQMATMMATHQDMASRMLDAMVRDMRGMNMTPDAAWTNVQSLAFYTFHTAMKERGAVTPQAAQPGVLQKVAATLSRSTHSSMATVASAAC